MNIRDRLESATERSVLLQILNDVKNDPQEFENVVEAVCDTLDLFGKFLTDKEYTSKLEPVILSLPPVQSIIGIGKSLSKIKNATFRDVMTVLGWLRAVVEHRFGQIVLDSLAVRESDVDTVQLYRDFTVTCVHLPEKISNCRIAATSDVHLKYINTVLWVFKKHLQDGLQNALKAAHENNSKNGAKNLNTVAELLSAGRNMTVGQNQNFQLLARMMKFLAEIPDFDEKWAEMSRKLFLEPTVQGVQVHEALLTAVFLSARNEVQLERCLSPRELSPTLKRVVTVKLPFQRILEPMTTKLLIDFIVRFDQSLSLLVELCQTALQIWSDPNYAKRAPEEQEKHLTRMIVYILHFLRTSSIPDWTELLLTVSSGVQTRLELTRIHMKSALFINQTLFRLAAQNDKDAPEPPDYKLDDEWANELKNVLEVGILKKYPEEEDSDEEYSDEDEEESEEEEPPTSYVPKVKEELDSDDEEFPEYVVDEAEKKFEQLQVGEEPKKTVPPPAYIADAFEMLLEKEKYEIFEAAFHHLPSLIRRRAVGFPQLADKIFLRVLHTDNTFGTPKFLETVEQIAVGCLVQRPEIVPGLVAQLIQTGQRQSVMHQLVHFVNLAADELAGDIQSGCLKNVVKYQSVVLVELNTGAEEEWRQRVDARIRANTRIISHGYDPPDNVAPNRLGAVVDCMFWPLLVPSKNLSSPDLLANLIMVASMVLVRSGLPPTITRMAAALIDYSTPHRFSENAKVRTACLAAHVNVMARLPDAVMRHVFSHETRQTWLEWAESVYSNTGNSEMERGMARQLITLIVKDY